MRFHNSASNALSSADTEAAGGLDHGLLKQVGDQVAERPSVEVGLLLEPLQDVPKQRRRDALRAAAEQISGCDSSNSSPTGLG